MKTELKFVEAGGYPETPSEDIVVTIVGPPERVRAIEEAVRKKAAEFAGPEVEER